MILYLLALILSLVLHFYSTHSLYIPVLCLPTFETFIPCASSRFREVQHACLHSKKDSERSQEAAKELWQQGSKNRKRLCQCSSKKAEGIVNGKERSCSEQQIKREETCMWVWEREYCWSVDRAKREVGACKQCTWQPIIPVIYSQCTCTHYDAYVCT